MRPTARPRNRGGFVVSGDSLSHYINRWSEHQSLPNATVWEDTKSTRVTYRGTENEKFRVIIRQKPNAIGFHAKLPGDRRK